MLLRRKKHIPPMKRGKFIFPATPIVSWRICSDLHGLIVADQMIRTGMSWGVSWKAHCSWKEICQHGLWKCRSAPSAQVVVGKQGTDHHRFFRRIQTTFKRKSCKKKYVLPLHTEKRQQKLGKKTTQSHYAEHCFPWPALMCLRKAAGKKRSRSELEIFAFVQPRDVQGCQWSREKVNRYFCS